MGIFKNKQLQEKLIEIENLNKKVNAKEYELTQTKNKLHSVENDLFITSEKYKKIKKRYEELDGKSFDEVKDYIEKVHENIEEEQFKFDSLVRENEELKLQINKKQAELFDVEDKLLNESFGIYEPIFTYKDSEEFKNAIKRIRNKQKEMIKNKTALNYHDSWALDGNMQAGESLNNKIMKLVLRAFNNECDNLIKKVKFNNYEKVEKQIINSAKTINDLAEKNSISIREDYLDLKIEELQLTYENKLKQNEEKEQIRIQKELEKEERKLQEEIMQARTKISKEIEHYTHQKSELLKKLDSANTNEVDLIKEKISNIDVELDRLKQESEDVDYRETHQRAGFVYIISNIGAFGENIYKIGMTRRLNPEDRVDELSNASVPFKFDIHAMIFSEDAPKLESTLHKTFEKYRVNKVNSRKEFYKLDLKEIEKVVKENHDQLVNFVEEPNAEQYRETKLIEKYM